MLPLSAERPWSARGIWLVSNDFNVNGKVPGRGQSSGLDFPPGDGTVTAAASPGDCFIVMPYGRNAQEMRWFQGWYNLVIESAVIEAGFRPVLAAAQDRPDAINDEIRAHLALDPMAVIDLGGLVPDAEPNPNVMYELGIRHAFNLPHVIMAWEGQKLPFDISNQRVIMERREFADVRVNKDRLTKFIREAAAENYYRPMDAVGRVATLDLAERNLRPNSILGALVEEVRSLKTRLPSPPPEKQAQPTATNPKTEARKAFGLTAGKRKELFKKFVEAGGAEAEWAKVLADIDQGVAVRAPNADRLATLLELAKKYRTAKEQAGDPLD